MKKVLLASTALVLSAGIAAADVSVGGSGRMGLIGGGTDDTGTAFVDETDIAFTSRIRITFSASGETDAGLSFGGSIRADNAGGGNNGTAGDVFVEGTFGKISMGDVSGAAEAAVGDVSGVGLTGLGDYNEMVYLSNNSDLAELVTTDSNGRPAARWDYTVADFGVHVSANNPGDSFDVYSIAVSYSMGNISFGLGYESADDGTTSADHVIGGVTAGFGDATVKAIYGEANDGVDLTQYGLSLDFVSGATTFTVFYTNFDDGVDDAGTTGVGVSYDLGGGASIVAGYVDSDFEDDGLYDVGINMSF